MNQQVPDVDLRFSELQTQIDKLTVTLQRWQQAQEKANPAEARLSELVERCATTLTRWIALDTRHEQVVARLEAQLTDWSRAETRLEQDSDRRVKAFEEFIEHEGETLRTLHAEPVKQLREQAANLEETCIAAANLALSGFERAEQRLTFLEHDLQNRLDRLAHQVEAAVVELRGGSASHVRALPSGTPFPLESVMRIHEEVRRSEAPEDGDQVSPVHPAPTSPIATPAPGGDDSWRPAESDRVEARERDPGPLRDEAAVNPVTAAPSSRSSPIRWLVAAAGVVALALVAWQLLRVVEARLNEASNRVVAAEQRAEEARTTATREIASTRNDAERQIGEARQTARQAEIVSQVLAAPDLARYNLAGTPAANGLRPYAQFLWSRSRGFVLSASRLPSPPAGSAYQLWLFTSAGPVSGGTFAPDSAGRATLSTDAPPNPRGPLTGVAVTVERGDGSAAPGPNVVLTRVQ